MRVLAPLPPVAGAVKYGGKALDFLDEGATFANKYLNKFDIQPGLSIKSVDNAYRPGYVYKTVNTVNGKKYIGAKLSKKGKNYVGSKLGAIDKTENYLGSGTVIKNIANKRPDDLYKTILGKTNTRRELNGTRRSLVKGYESSTRW